MHTIEIVFGAPGTGKSFKLNDEQKDLISEGGEYERVTFHPELFISKYMLEQKSQYLQKMEYHMSMFLDHLCGHM